MRFSRLFRPVAPALLGLSLTAALLSCSKDKKDDPQPATTENRMAYTYAGTAHTLTGNSVGAIWDHDNKTLYLTGTLAGSQFVVLNAINVTGPGTYTLTRNTNALSSYGAFSLINSSGSPTATWQSQRGPASPAPGTIIITKFDEANETAEGTFSFSAGPSAGLPGTATGTAVVSAGSFGVYSWL